MYKQHGEEKLRQTIRNRPLAFTIMLSAAMTAAVTVTTYIIQIPVPATSGYINIGDAMVFTSALLFGPIVGGLAGGIGSSIADMWGGYWIFVPITLLVKGFEGALTGLITDGRSSRKDLAAVLIGGLEMVLGYFIAEALVLGYGAAAFVEIPGNIFQVVVGCVVSIPVARMVRSRMRPIG
jgi:uncharacterized membrane protein